MNVLNKETVKEILGEIPLTAEIYWYLRQYGKPLTADFSLEKLGSLIPGWQQEAESSPLRSHTGKRVFIFATLRYWIEHATLLGITLAGLGHDVTLSYLPYAKWQTSIDRFNLRRHNVYAQGVLQKATPLIKVTPLLNVKKTDQLPSPLWEAVEDVALRDTQYTLQVEDVELNSDLYQLRLERNIEAAQRSHTWMESDPPDVVVIPNGTIMEFGVIYQVARYLKIPTVTYEFGEQRGRIWLAQNAEVMRQETNELWEVHKDDRFSDEQLDQVRTLFASRQRASLWENFARRWQGVPSEGGEKVRTTLGLDDRPIVLLATNVIGDSLTLGRQIFSDSMTEWLERTVQYFAQRPDVQFVVRIHPGELITKGPSVADVVQRTLPELPEHIHLVSADAQVNTYDIVEIADMGLVYTTTVGMEMVMSGVPVIVIGNTHYRGKGFTLDPDSWESYFDLLDKVLVSPQDFRPTTEEVEQVWNYAYCFFFLYPHPFPWHLLHIWNALDEWPVSRVLSDEGQATFGRSFDYMVGHPVDWAVSPTQAKLE
jgi:hypothetical protein